MSRVLTPEQRAEALDLRRRGLSFGQIGRRYRVTDGCIAALCMREGVEPPPELARRPRPFTADEDRHLAALVQAGDGWADIGRAMGRHRVSVRVRWLTLQRLARRAEQRVAA
jgi:hypothetical protein